LTFASGGSRPSAVAVGDFNGDGNADLAVANLSSNTAKDDSGSVGVLLGVGSGGFAAAVPFAAGGSAFSVAVGDFNNDGNADVAMPNFLKQTVSVLLGDGSGGFAAAVPFATGGYNPVSVAVGDFNNDGQADLAVANYDGNTVGVLLNTTNQPPVNTVPGDHVAAEDVATVIGGLSVADDDAAGILTVTFAVENGTLTVGDSVAGGLTAADISGNGTAALTLTGTQAQINATLAAADGLTYLGEQHYSGLDTLTMTTTDAGGLSDTDLAAIEVLSAQQQAEVLAAVIADLGDDGVLSGGQENALLDKLSFLSTPNAENKVQAFINQINAFASAGILTQEQADELIDAAESIVASMQ
jgi:hypothetical protein